MGGGVGGLQGLCLREGGVLGDQALFPSMSQFFMDRRAFKTAFHVAPHSIQSQRMSLL